MTIPTDRSARERWILDAVIAGRHDPIRWCPVTTSVGVMAGGHTATFYVSADYLRVDGVLMPCNAMTSQMVADHLDVTLPTAHMVDAIWRAAVVKLAPLPWGPPYDSSMLSTARILEHSRRIDTQLQGRHGELTAGHKKDVVLTTRLVTQPTQVAIYGWHQLDGKPIQPLSLIHEASYGDYAHGLRLIRKDAVGDGVATTVAAILASPALAPLLTSEPLPAVLRYPNPDNTPAPTPPPPEGSHPMHQVIRRGSKGQDVADWQRIVGVTADGAFGAMTESKTKTWQAMHGLTADGVVGPKSWAASKVPPPPLSKPYVADEKHVEAPPVAFIQAKNFRKGRVDPATGKPCGVSLVVLHDMEAAEASSTAENVAKWFAGAAAPMASAHYCCDNDSVVGCVREADTAFHAPGANHSGVGIEMAGYAKQTAAEWGDAYSIAMLERVASLTAAICKRHSLPVEFVDEAGLLSGKRGVTTHRCVSAAFKKSTHSDPGPNFDMPAFLAMVRRG